MIRPLPKVDRARQRFLGARQWHTRFVPFAILQVEGFGRTVVVMNRLETRWSDNQRRRLWRLPSTQIRATTR